MKQRYDSAKAVEEMRWGIAVMTFNFKHQLEMDEDTANRLRRKIVEKNRQLADLQVKLVRYKVYADQKDIENLQIIYQASFHKCQATICQLFPDLKIPVIEAPMIERLSEMDAPGTSKIDANHPEVVPTTGGEQGC